MCPPPPKKITGTVRSRKERHNPNFVHFTSRFVLQSFREMPSLGNVDPRILSCVGPPPVHQLIRNDKTEKPPTVTVSSAPTFSSVLRPEDGHRGIESPHSQTGMYSFFSFRRFSDPYANCLSLFFSFSLSLVLDDGCESYESGCRPMIRTKREGWTRHLQIYIYIYSDTTRIECFFY